MPLYDPRGAIRSVYGRHAARWKSSRVAACLGLVGLAAVAVTSAAVADGVVVQAIPTNGEAKTMKPWAVDRPRVPETEVHAEGCEGSSYLDVVFKSNAKVGDIISLFLKNQVVVRDGPTIDGGALILGVADGKKACRLIKEFGERHDIFLYVSTIIYGERRSP